MSKPKIIKELKTKNPNIKSEDLEKIFDLFLEEIIEALLNKKSIEIRSFGTFFVKEIKEKKQARNPKTGEPYKISDRNVVSFRASKKLRESL